ncbi:hypothetical protein [Deinococcus roseus]|uniref:WYL domain-containing protein n=1 Tax=Deinococcus roseus TaxID=392414 RepID=A0ABQ2CTP0_9DEIO|nr:hypothetical protein [Deinococcus roseus]GGJ19239.1 hypothetical protein GCM10008938_01630 [Deinococcus roseus]
MKRATMSTCSARWVPGTSNRLYIDTPEGQSVVSLERFEQICGRQATHDLYLRGAITVEIPENMLRNLVA